MYLEHFGLQDKPFSLTPNTHYYCDASSAQEAYNTIMFAVRSGEGFIKIVGEVGTGKTMLCRKLLNSLEDDYVTAYIPNPSLTPHNLIKALAYELGVEVPNHSDINHTQRLISDALLEYNKNNKQVLFIIDEAQALSDDSLEMIRLLSNLETESSKLLQIVLFGQPELNIRLLQHEFRQLNQRIVFSCQLSPLTREELDAYVTHRLCVAGNTQGNLFTKKAKDYLHHYSSGKPRIVNILAHKALLLAYGKGHRIVGNRDVAEAAKDSEEIVHQNSGNTGLLTIFAAICVGAAVAVYATRFINLL